VIVFVGVLVIIGFSVGVGVIVTGGTTCNNSTSFGELVLSGISQEFINSPLHPLQVSSLVAVGFSPSDCIQNGLPLHNPLIDKS